MYTLGYLAIIIALDVTIKGYLSALNVINCAFCTSIAKERIPLPRQLKQDQMKICLKDKHWTRCVGQSVQNKQATTEWYHKRICKGFKLLIW